MTTKTWVHIISAEIVLAVICCCGVVVEYGKMIPEPYLKPRSSPMRIPCVTPSVMPIPQTNAPRTISPASTLKGEATWYNRKSCRREGTGGSRILMANGKPLDDNAMSAAMWIEGRNGRPLAPDGRLVRVRNVANGTIIVVAWLDNGPGRAQRGKGIVIDLTPTAFKALGGNLKDGKIKVIVERTI